MADVLAGAWLLCLLCLSPLVFPVSLDDDDDDDEDLTFFLLVGLVVDVVDEDEDFFFELVLEEPLRCSCLCSSLVSASALGFLAVTFTEVESFFLV